MNHFFPEQGRGLHPAKGYALIDIALALVVLGFVLAVTLAPAKAIMQKNRADRAEVELNHAYNAVVEFALRARTAPRVLAAAASPKNIGDIHISGGRPYFPCPDVNGDGLEDRAAGSDLVTLVTPLAAPGGAQQPVIPGPGSCVSQKGILPWRTVGSRASDPWGNRYTYHVDIAFSNSVLGFDQNSRADVFDPRRISGGNYMRRDAGVTAAPNYVMPVTLCAKACALITSTLQSAPDSADIIAAEVWTGADIPAASAARPYRQNDATGGPVFVLLSHGPNGAGAIAGGQSAAIPGGNLKCNPPPASADSAGERENASYFRADFPCDSTLPEFSNTIVNRATRYTHPAARPVAGGGGNRGLSGYDDIVKWLSADALFVQLENSGYFNTGKKDEWHLE